MDVYDYRPSTLGSLVVPDPNKTVQDLSGDQSPHRTYRAILKPTNATLWADIALMHESSPIPWNEDKTLEMEKLIMQAVPEPICLDPSIEVMKIANLQNFNRTKEVLTSRKRPRDWDQKEMDDTSKRENAEILLAMEDVGSFWRQTCVESSCGSLLFVSLFLVLLDSDTTFTPRMYHFDHLVRPSFFLIFPSHFPFRFRTLGFVEKWREQAAAAAREPLTYSDNKRKGRNSNAVSNMVWNNQRNVMTKRYERKYGKDEDGNDTRLYTIVNIYEKNGKFVSVLRWGTSPDTATNGHELVSTLGNKEAAMAYLKDIDKFLKHGAVTTDWTHPLFAEAKAIAAGANSPTPALAQTPTPATRPAAQGINNMLPLSAYTQAAQALNADASPMNTTMTSLLQSLRPEVGQNAGANPVGCSRDGRQASRVPNSPPFFFYRQTYSLLELQVSTPTLQRKPAYPPTPCNKPSALPSKARPPAATSATKASQWVQSTQRCKVNS